MNVTPSETNKEVKQLGQEEDGWISDTEGLQTSVYRKVWISQLDDGYKAWIQIKKSKRMNADTDHKRLELKVMKAKLKFMKFVRFDSSLLGTRFGVNKLTFFRVLGHVVRVTEIKEQNLVCFWLG